MLYGTVPFKANNMNDLHKMIIKAKYSLKESMSDNVKDLLKKLLEPDPAKRLKINKVLDHIWFTDVDETIELFTEEEHEKIKKEFTYKDASRLNRNKDNAQISYTSVISNDFTEHPLESSMNDDLRNVSTKSVILAPFNSTRTHFSEGDL